MSCAFTATYQPAIGVEILLVEPLAKFLGIFFSAFIEGSVEIAQMRGVPRRFGMSDKQQKRHFRGALSETKCVRKSAYPLVFLSGREEIFKVE